MPNLFHFSTAMFNARRTVSPAPVTNPNTVHTHAQAEIFFLLRREGGFSY